MPTVRRTTQAHLDLVEISLRIARPDPTAAGRWLDLIDEKCQLPARMPEPGRKRRDLAPELRSLPEGSYILFYRPQGDGIQVVRVLYGSRDLPPLFES